MLVLEVKTPGGGPFLLLPLSALYSFENQEAMEAVSGSSDGYLILSKCNYPLAQDLDPISMLFVATQSIP